MLKRFEFCLPTTANAGAAGAYWFHEVKYDGYRLRIERDGDKVRLITGGGHDWSGRYPWIAAAARRNRITQFVIDGEAVVLGIDGISDFNAMHSGNTTRLCAFDVLAIDGEDLRGLPLSMRKTHLERLLRGPHRRHLYQPVRDKLDRARALPRGLQHGPRGYGFQASRSAVPGRTIEGLDQGEEPDAPRV